MNYVPIIAGTNSNDFAGKGTSFDTGQSSMETGPSQDYILMPLWNDGSLFDSSLKDSDGDNKNNDGLCKESEIDNQERANAENSTKDVNTVGSSINIASSNINIASPTVNTVRQSDDFFGADNNMRSLDGVEVDIRNISTTYHVPATLNTRIHKDHSLDNVIGKRAIGTKWVFRNKKDERGIVIRNKARLYAQGFTQEEGINYDEVFSPVARIEAIRLFLAYASFMGFLVYQMDIKSAFLYGRIEDEVCVCQPPGFEHPDYPDKVYKVEKALYGLNQAPRACSTKKELCTKFEKLMHDKFQMSSMGELTFFLGFQVKQKSDGIFISHDKYIDENLRKFKYTDFKPASTLMDKEKALLKDLAGDDVDVHLYRITFAGEAQQIWLSLILDKKMIKYELSNAFLKKPQGSEDFHQIADFLNATHIRYALTENPTIYVSLINQFWCTASAKTLDNGEIELNSIVDGQDKTITEASVKRHDRS
nr:hypothetical protein [Tanacetum cinerariifolium]